MRVHWTLEARYEGLHSDRATPVARVSDPRTDLFTVAHHFSIRRVPKVWQPQHDSHRLTGWTALT